MAPVRAGAAAAYPDAELRVVLGNYGAHKRAKVREWLAKTRITLHFTPASCSWLSLVECFFSVITRLAVRRGSFRSIKELVTAIGAFIDTWNQHPRPFAWAKGCRRGPRQGRTRGDESKDLANHW